MASLEIGNYVIEHNMKTGRFDVYKKGVGFIISCLSPTACRQVIIALNQNEGKEEEVIDKAILDEIERLNSIKEPIRDRKWKNILPANDNSLLNTPLAKATRELLGKQK